MRCRPIKRFQYTPSGRIEAMRHREKSALLLRAARALARSIPFTSTDVKRTQHRRLFDRLEPGPSH
jgi:hypothetical protein